MFFFFQAEDGIRDLVRSRGLGDVYKRQMVTVASSEKEDILEEVNYKQNHFERKFFSEETNLSLIHI